MTRVAPLLNAAQLACLRDQIDLPDTCVIERDSGAANTVGDRTQTWTALATVACRVGPYRMRPGDERVFGGRISSGVLWQVTLPAGTDVTARDRIVHLGRTLQIISVLAPRTYEVVRFVIAMGEV